MFLSPVFRENSDRVGYHGCVEFRCDAREAVPGARGWMKFELVGHIANVEVMAAGPGVRIRSFLRKAYEADGYGPASEWRSSRCGVTLV
jgi:hypothetical protein